MAKFIIEVEEGKTPSCSECPYNEGGITTVYCGLVSLDLDCDKYDMRTLKITKQ